MSANTNGRPKIYSADPKALMAANPATLTEAQRNYRAMLYRQEAERIVARLGGDVQAMAQALMVQAEKKYAEHQPMESDRHTLIEEDRARELQDRIDLFN